MQFDHRTKKVEAWGFYINFLSIITSFIYAHYAAFREEYNAYRRYMIFAEFCFFLDFNL